MHTAVRPIRKAKPTSELSWSSLVATTLGMDDFGRLQAVVSARLPNLEGYRLVVQSYAASAMNGGLPGLYAKPLSAAQRAVTSEELERGVGVNLVHSDDSATHEGCVVIAWVEPGHPDLDYDGLCARPAGAVFVGTTFASSERAEVILGRSAA